MKIAEYRELLVRLTLNNTRVIWKPKTLSDFCHLLDDFANVNMSHNLDIDDGDPSTTSAAAHFSESRFTKKLIERGFNILAIIYNLVIQKK
ncbi:hypothetical protein GCM10008957_09170 [Deinococcus ruber]|uniref:Uncharacterized protein n=1 Tax=Deinococcus ruber TaxID=1848197 RepID=A0A918F1J6_9DEIO|nr:hypothetical protein GCM10008957_09170 [Deinococcus ruber]